jgi:hypothetical protein
VGFLDGGVVDVDVVGADGDEDEADDVSLVATIFVDPEKGAEDVGAGEEEEGEGEAHEAMANETRTVTPFTCATVPRLRARNRYCFSSALTLEHALDPSEAASLVREHAADRPDWERWVARRR